MKDFVKWVKSLSKNDIDPKGLDAVIKSDKAQLVSCSCNQKERKELRKELRVLEKIRASLIG